MVNGGWTFQNTKIHSMGVYVPLTNIAQGYFMLVSHRYRFILFLDPLGACPWMAQALLPWIDQPLPPRRGMGSHFFQGMSPAEAELAFDAAGLAYRNYTRIAIVRNPFTKMAQLYDRIAASDRLWQMRRRVGVSVPEYTRWLASIRPDGNGAAFTSAGPRWRRFGAWSAMNWCQDRVTHVVRAETAEQDLSDIFRDIGVTPSFGARPIDTLRVRQPVSARYGPEANQLIRERYKWDLQLYEKQPADLRLVA